MNSLHLDLAPKPLNWRQETPLTTFAIGIILFSAAAYWFGALSLTVSYSLLGSGTSFIVGGLIHLAIQSCQKKTPASPFIHDPIPSGASISGNPSKDPPSETVVKPAEEKSMETTVATEFVSDIHEKPAEERPEIELLKDLHYHPDQAILKKYSYSFKNEQDGIEFLGKFGQKAGDYILLPSTSADALHFAWLDQDLIIRKTEIHDPIIWHGNMYNIVYDKIRYPLLPHSSKLNRSAIHHSLIGYKYRSLLKDLESDNRSYTTIGLLQDFILWLKDSENMHRFDPHIFFKIVGHVFGLSGKYTYLFRGANVSREIECTVDYEGFDPYLGRSIIMRDFSDYLSSKAVLPSAYKQKIKLMCENAYVASDTYSKNSKDNPSLSDLIKLLKEGNPITILTGWEGHAVNLTMTETELIYTNKGDKSGDFPGMHRFNIRKPITEDLLAKIVALRNPEDFPLESNDESNLTSLLNLEHTNSYSSFYQKTGCCVFANNRLCYKAAALLFKGTECPEWAAHCDFKGALNASREFWLEAIFTIINKAPNDENLKTELYFFLCLLRKKIELRSLIMQTTKEGDRVLLEKMREQAEIWRKEDSHPYLELIVGENRIPIYHNFEKQHHAEFFPHFFLNYCIVYKAKAEWIEENKYNKKE